ncbi:hypothetical protein HK104_002301, partial [Borealophlyctis nickersoniae]
PSTPTSPQTLSSTTCSICMTDYTPGDRLRSLACTHTFHKPCIDTWLLPDKSKGTQGHRTCPLCIREAVKPEQRDPKVVKAMKRRVAEEREGEEEVRRVLEMSRREAEERAARVDAENLAREREERERGGGADTGDGNRTSSGGGGGDRVTRGVEVNDNNGLPPSPRPLPRSSSIPFGTPIRTSTPLPSPPMGPKQMEEGHGGGGSGGGG